MTPSSPTVNCFYTAPTCHVSRVTPTMSSSPRTRLSSTVSHHGLKAASASVNSRPPKMALVSWEAITNTGHVSQSHVYHHCHMSHFYYVTLRSLSISVPRLHLMSSVLGTESVFEVYDCLFTIVY